MLMELKIDPLKGDRKILNHLHFEGAVHGCLVYLSVRQSVVVVVFTDNHVDVCGHNPNIVLSQTFPPDDWMIVPH